MYGNVTQSELKVVLKDEQLTFHSLSALGLNRSSVWNAENHLLHRVLSWNLCKIVFGTSSDIKYVLKMGKSTLIVTL